jgi:hypothetical protein
MAIIVITMVIMIIKEEEAYMSIVDFKVESMIEAIVDFS